MALLCAPRYCPALLLTLVASPAQVLSIVTAGAKNGKGLFFPKGLNGVIH